jgi:hypothetical protein
VQKANWEFAKGEQEKSHPLYPISGVWQVFKLALPLTSFQRLENLCAVFRRTRATSGGPTMARKPKLITNYYDPEKLEGYLIEIDAADDALLELKIQYMERCKGPRGDIADTIEAANEAGIPQAAFRAVVKNRRLQRKIANNTEKLEADDRDNYDRICAALGDFVDLPLGKAAADRGRSAEQLDGLA